MPAEWPPGELMQSITYREAYAPALPLVRAARPLGAVTDTAPQLMRTAAGAAWALVSLISAGCVAVLVLVVLVRLVGALT